MVLLDCGTTPSERFVELLFTSLEPQISATDLSHRSQPERKKIKNISGGQVGPGSRVEHSRLEIQMEDHGVADVSSPLP